MAITDQQFEDWLKTAGLFEGAEVRRVLLAEANYYPTGGPEATRYMANRPYVSRPTDAPANVAYDDIIAGLPMFATRISEIFSGHSQSGWGDLVIANESGVRDGWLNDGLDGRALKLYIGDASWPKSDFRSVLVGYSADIVVPNGNELALRIRDRTWVLNVPLQKNLIGGATVNLSKLKPLCYGFARNISPPLITAATHEYQVHDGAINSIDDVRDSGVSLISLGLTVSAVDTATDTITASANHGFSIDTRVELQGPCPAPIAALRTYWVIAAGLTANTFRLSDTKGGAAVDLTSATTGADIIGKNWNEDVATGKVTLVATPAGNITCDARGAASVVAGLTVSAVNAATDTITFSSAHGLVAGDRIIFAGTVPAPIVAGYYYWVCTAGLTSDSCKVSVFGPSVVENITGSTTGATATGYAMRLKCADAVKDILTTRTALTSADLDAASFSDFNTTCPQKFGFFHMEYMSVASAIDELVASLGGFWTFGLDGKMLLGRFDAPSGTPALELLADDVVRGGIVVAARILPIKTYRLGYKQNFTVQTGELAGAVTEADRANYGRENGTIESTNTGVDIQFLLARHPDQVDTLMTENSEAATEVARRATLWSVLRYLYKVRCFAAPLKLRVGQVVRITHPRFGFAAGKLVTIVGINWSPIRGGVNLEVFA